MEHTTALYEGVSSDVTHWDNRLNPKEKTSNNKKNKYDACQDQAIPYLIDVYKQTDEGKRMDTGKDNDEIREYVKKAWAKFAEVIKKFL